MTLKQAVNRTLNLLAVTVSSLAAIAFLPEVFIEDKWWFKVDDALLFLVGVAAIIWYRTGSHRFKRSLIPLVFVYLGLVIKILGIILEIKENDDVGDDFGGLILFIGATIVVSIVYVQSKKLLSSLGENREKK